MIIVSGRARCFTKSQLLREHIFGLRNVSTDLLSMIIVRPWFTF